MKAANIRLDDRSLINPSKNGALRGDVFHKIIAQDRAHYGCVIWQQW